MYGKFLTHFKTYILYFMSYLEHVALKNIPYNNLTYQFQEFMESQANELQSDLEVLWKKDVHDHSLIKFYYVGACVVYRSA